MDDNQKKFTNKNDEVPDVPYEKPPILGSWRNLYYVVVGFLVLQIILYYLLTQYLQ